MNEIITDNTAVMGQLIQSLKVILEEEKEITPDLVNNPQVRAYLDSLFPDNEVNRDRFLRLMLMQTVTKSGELDLLKIDTRSYKEPDQMTAAEVGTAKAKAEERKSREDVRHGITISKLEDREEQLGLFEKTVIEPKNYRSKLEKHFFRHAEKQGLELKAQQPIKTDDRNLWLDYMIMDNGMVTPFCVEIMSRQYHANQLSEDYKRHRDIMAKAGVIFIFIDSYYIYKKPAAAVKEVLRIYKTMKKKYGHKIWVY